MRTNEQIFESIKSTGYITEKEISLLKSRSNKAQKDLFDYDIIDNEDIKIHPEQGVKGLQWLKKFIRKDGTSNVYGYRELDIIERATPSDFTFMGFYEAGNGFVRNYVPVYELLGMEYIPFKEPYIIG